MNNFKDWYNNKKGKQIMFFAFYIAFFIFLAIYIRSNDKKIVDEPKEETKEQIVEKKITTYSINNLINNDYQYEIIILDENDMITFKGNKNNIDYANYENKYFLDIYNINQLLKKSKFIDTKNNILTYELDNSEINDVLLTDKPSGINKIELYVNDLGEVEKITIDLSNYLEKSTYQININYILEEENENSVS